MSTKNYTKKLIFMMGLVLLIVSTGANAQRGRGHSYRHFGHSYYHGPRAYSYSHPYLSLGYGGINYRHHAGYFYHPFPGYYHSFLPPFGFRISILPPGYRRIYVGSYPYYYYNGTYYSPSDRNDYKVVAPPLGAKVPELPRNAQAVIIDGQKYYELDGTYYQEEINKDNELRYTVVGINGELRTGNAVNGNNNTADQVGDRVDKLPADCRAVNISGKKYFQSPAGLYYEEIISPNKVYYEVVGKSDE